MSNETSERTDSTEYVPVPEYEVSQYFPRSPQYTDDQRRRIRKKYGRIRAYFKLRPDRYRNLQRWLNQARMGSTYDLYLQRITYYAMAAAFVGILAGLLAATWLETLGVLTTLSSPVKVTGSVVDFVAGNKEVFASAVIVVLSSVFVGGGSWLAMYHYPRMVVDNRRRNIDFMLPHAITFMYALSYGGMNLLEVFDQLADSEDAYGEVAHEFEMILRDVELFGNDLVTALRNARNLTPSDNLEQFLDDLMAVIDAGGDPARFFEEQSEHYLDEAKDEQESFLEILELLSEVFIVGFVAAPLFLIVIMMVISLLGGSTLLMLRLLIYVGLPLGMAGFVVLISTLSDPYVQPETVLKVDDHSMPGAEDAPVPEGDARLGAYRKSQRWEPLQKFLADPLKAARLDPKYSLLASVPATVLYYAAILTTGFVPLRNPATAGAGTTIWLVVFPFLILAVPLAAFHEYERGRERLVTRRFPDTLNILSSANQMGIPLTEALEMVSRWASGLFAGELRMVRNDIEWNGDTERALLAFANRLSVPQVSRTIKLIAEGGRSSGDLSRILRIAADDTRNRHKIDTKRRNAMASYIAIVVISFMVFLMVVALLESSYLAPIEEIQRTAAAQATTGTGSPVSLADVPVDAYRTLFFHAALVMGVGSGLLAGKLADNRLMTGLKYSVFLVVLSILAFTLL